MLYSVTWIYVNFSPSLPPLPVCLFLWLLFCLSPLSRSNSLFLSPLSYSLYLSFYLTLISLVQSLLHVQHFYMYLSLSISNLTIYSCILSHSSSSSPISYCFKPSDTRYICFPQNDPKHWSSWGVAFYSIFCVIFFSPHPRRSLKKHMNNLYEQLEHLHRKVEGHKYIHTLCTINLLHVSFRSLDIIHVNVHLQISNYYHHT